MNRFSSPNSGATKIQTDACNGCGCCGKSCPPNTVVEYPGCGADRVPLTPEELGDKFGISRAFVSLMLQCGCPTEKGRISHYCFIEWLAGNYETARAQAGLAPLPSILETDVEWRVSERRKRGFLTLLQFMDGGGAFREFTPISTSRQTLHACR